MRYILFFLFVPSLIYSMQTDKKLLILSSRFGSMEVGLTDKKTDKKYVDLLRELKKNKLTVADIAFAFHKSELKRVYTQLKEEWQLSDDDLFSWKKDVRRNKIKHPLDNTEFYYNSTMPIHYKELVPLFNLFRAVYQSNYLGTLVITFDPEASSIVRLQPFVSADLSNMESLENSYAHDYYKIVFNRQFLRVNREAQLGWLHHLKYKMLQRQEMWMHFIVAKIRSKHSEASAKEVYDSASFQEYRSFLSVAANNFHALSGADEAAQIEAMYLTYDEQDRTDHPFFRTYDKHRANAIRLRRLKEIEKRSK